MAFGRKKRRQEAEEGEAPATEASTAVEPSPAPEGTEASTTVEPSPPPEGTEADPARPTAVGEDVAEAAIFAGDPAAAGTDAEGSGADPMLESASSGDDNPPSLATATAGTAADRAEALVEERPELLVAGAFAGGLVLARVIAALGGRR